MAAQVVANDLNLDAYRIDLSLMVSKCIGETEKYRSRVFDTAGHPSTILFFDEAKVLIGNRTQVREGHGRYANI
jgi:SpoVK/Ycf46/Vps4 family AAA+-type ATPase